MKMKTAKKVLLGIALVCIAIVVLELISGIFGVKFYNRPLNQILMTAITLALGSIFALGALSFFDDNKIISIVDLSLIGLSVVMFVIFYLRGFKMHETYFKITGIVAIITVIFNSVVSAGVKLKNKFIYLQVISATDLAFIGFTLIMSILGHYWLKNSLFLKIFCALAIIELGLLLAITALSKRSSNEGENSPINNTSTKITKDKVVLSIEEYNAMMLKIKNLEDELKQLKSNQN